MVVTPDAASGAGLSGCCLENAAGNAGFSGRGFARIRAGGIARIRAGSANRHSLAAARPGAGFAAVARD
jgi:hypothetical protein